MIEYFKNAKVYKLPNKQIYSTRNPGHVTQSWGKDDIGQGHKGT